MPELIDNQDSLLRAESSETISSPEKELSPIESQLINKLRMSIDLSRDYLDSIPGKNYGKVMNQDLIGRIFSRSIFGSKNKIPELEELIESRPDLAEKLEQIYTPLPGLRPVNFRDHLEFADKFRSMVSRHSLPDRPEYEDKEYKDIVYFDGAQDEVKKMLKYGPARIWTAGDMYGLPEEGLKGSGEQRKRIAQAKWGEFRISALQDGQDFDALMHENKFDLLEDLAREYGRAQVDKFVVVDDKVANLDEARAKLVEAGVEAQNIILIWDRQGNGGLGAGVKGKDKSEIDELEARYNAIDNVENIVAKADSILDLEHTNIKVGWVIDHDDVLSSTKQAKEIIEKNVLDWLKENQVY